MSDNWEMTEELDQITVADALSAIKLLRAKVEYERGLTRRLVDRMKAHGFTNSQIWGKEL